MLVNKVSASFFAFGLSANKTSAEATTKRKEIKEIRKRKREKEKEREKERKRRERDGRERKREREREREREKEMIYFTSMCMTLVVICL